MHVRHNYKRKNLLLALLILLAANLLIGSFLISESKTALKAQIDQRMLDIANTAAYMLDGDEMKALTAADRGSREYEDALEILRSFQQSIDMSYIYAINCEEDGTFTFSVDPTIKDPGIFGDPIVSTDALRMAAKGIPAADAEPYEDDWGQFYSAYSPVIDSYGQVACIVAVDFSAEWIEAQSRKQVLTITVGTLISLLIGAVFAGAIFNRYKKSAQSLNEDMQEMASHIKALNNMVMAGSVKKIELMPDGRQAEALKALASGEHYDTSSQADEIALFDENLRSMVTDLKHYLQALHAQDFTDQMTGAGNRLAYKERINQINTMIEESPAECSFSIGLFDLNGLERVNTRYGFAVGDELLFSAAESIRKIYGQKNVFRIASDEFIVVLEGKGLLDMDEYNRALTKAIAAFNADRTDKPRLAISRGSSVYKPGEDHSYREVFVRAQERLEREKKAYYAKRNAENTDP